MPAAVHPFPLAFRMTWWPWLVAATVWEQVGVVLVLAAGLAVNPPGPAAWRAWAASYAAASTVGLLLTAPLMAGYVWWYRVRVGPGGLRGYSFWGWPTVVPWDAPAAVERRSFLGLPVLLVAGSPTGRRVWLAALMADPHGFAEAVSEHAGDDHPLTEALWERLAGG